MLMSAATNRSNLVERDSKTLTCGHSAGKILKPIRIPHSPPRQSAIVSLLYHLNIEVPFVPDPFIRGSDAIEMSAAD